MVEKENQRKRSGVKAGGEGNKRRWGLWRSSELNAVRFCFSS